MNKDEDKLSKLEFNSYVKNIDIKKELYLYYITIHIADVDVKKEIRYISQYDIDEAIKFALDWVENFDGAFIFKS